MLTDAHVGHCGRLHGPQHSYRFRKRPHVILTMLPRGSYVYATGLERSDANCTPLLVIEAADPQTGRLRVVHVRTGTCMRILSDRLSPYGSDVVMLPPPVRFEACPYDVSDVQSELSTGSLSDFELVHVPTSTAGEPSPDIYDGVNGNAFRAIHCLSLEHPSRSAWFMRKTASNAPEFSMAVAAATHSAAIMECSKKGKSMPGAYAVPADAVSLAVWYAGEYCVFKCGDAPSDVARAIEQKAVAIES